MMWGIFLISILVVSLVFLPKLLSKKKPSLTTFPENWKAILSEYVPFYAALSLDKKTRFENDVLQFINHHKITAVDTTLDEVTKVLVAASAIIPIFNFEHWNYPNLKEVLIFEERIESANHTDDNEILGMVTNDSFGDGVLLLSKQDLLNGFQIKTSKSNVGIHEFVHLIDKADGEVDGLPMLLMNPHLLHAWSESISQEINRIRHKGEKDIDAYGATSAAEFLAVISEYFFKRPQLLERKHPELYAILTQVFKQDVGAKVD